MAASMDWRKLLENHAIFEKLRESINIKSSFAHSKRLILMNDGIIFVWDNYNSCLQCANVKTLIGKAQDYQDTEDTHVVQVGKCLL